MLLRLLLPLLILWGLGRLLARIWRVARPAGTTRGAPTGALRESVRVLRPLRDLTQQEISDADYEEIPASRS
jgi:hypothetical protein